MFVLNENVVYPAHGVAKIVRVFEKNLADTCVLFFELKFLHKEMTILIPVNNLSASGIRKVSSTETVTAICRLLAQTCDGTKKEPFVNWNKRNKDYQCKLRTGNVYDVCTIYKDLISISLYKELSFGEKTLLQQTEMLLAQEISLVKKIGVDKAIEDIRSHSQHIPRSTMYSSVSKTL